MIERCTKIHLQKPAKWQKCNCIEVAWDVCARAKIKLFYSLDSTFMRAPKSDKGNGFIAGLQ